MMRSCAIHTASTAIFGLNDENSGRWRDAAEAVRTFDSVHLSEILFASIVLLMALARRKHMLRRSARVLLVVASLPLAFQMMGCGDKEYVCQTRSTVCGTFSACCTDDDCYYEWAGDKYPCDGTDCEAAAEELALDMCLASPRAADSAKDAKQVLTRTTKELAAQALTAPCAKCP
jgi:hypothetical protein